MSDFDLNAALKAIKKRNDETRDEWEEFQRSERAKLRDTDPKELYARRAIAIAEKKIAESAENNDLEFDRMAEGYYLLGDIEMAAAVAHDETRRAYYQRILEAVNRDNSEICSCPKKQQGNSTWFLTEQVGNISIFRCSLCGFENGQC